MASPSLKKTGKARKAEEGNYASSDNPDKSRVYDHGLGLTLLPGSQISKGGTKTSKAVTTDQPEACIKRSRVKNQVDSHVHTRDGPVAQVIPSPVGEISKPSYPQALAGNPYAIRLSIRWGSSIEYGSSLCDDESVAEHNIVSGPDICHSQGCSSSLAYGVGSRDGLLGVGDGDSKCDDESREMHHPIYARKRRKIGIDDTPVRVSKSTAKRSTISCLSPASDGQDMDKYFQDSQPKMIVRHATSRKPAPQPGPASSELRHRKQSSRYQCKSGTDNASARILIDTKLAQETSLRDAVETPKAITPPVTTMKRGLLENPDQRSLPLVTDHTGDGETATEDGVGLFSSAKPQNHVNTQSAQSIKHHSRSEPLRPLYTQLDIPSLSSLEASIGSLARVKPDVLSVLISPSSTLPSLECYSSAKSLQILRVKNPLFQKHHFQHKNYVKSKTDTYSSSSSAFSFIASTLHSSTCNSFLSSSLKLRRSASTSLALSSTSLAIDIIAPRPRKRSNSVPILRSNLPEASMNNPNMFQQHGLFTPEKSPPKRQICTPDTFSYYQNHGPNLSKMDPHRSAYNMAGWMPPTLIGNSAPGPYIPEERTDIRGPFSHKKEHSINMMNQAAQGYAPTQPGTSFAKPSQAQEFLHNAKHNSAGASRPSEMARSQNVTGFGNKAQATSMPVSHPSSKHNGFTEYSKDISSGLEAIVSGLAQRGLTKELVHRTLAFVKTLPIPGVLKHEIPIDEGYIQARKEGETLKVRLCEMQKRYAALEHFCRHNDHSYKAHIRTLEAEWASNSKEMQKRYMSLEEMCHRNNQSYTEQLRTLKGESAGKSNEIKKLSDDVDHWKNFAQQLCGLLKNPPSKSLSSETLYNRVVQGNATVGGSGPPSNLHTIATSPATSQQIPYAAEALSTSSMPGVAVATFGVSPVRKDSAYSLALSAAIDLTVDDNSLEGTPSYFDTSAPISRESSSQSHGSQALEQFTKNLAQKPLNWMDKHPLKAPQNPYLANTQRVMQSVIDVDAQPDPFVFNPTDEELQAAEARKNNASYASYQQKTRVTKNTKDPKATKAQQRQLEKGHAPAPKVTTKKAKKPRMRGPRETREQKVARLESERKEEVQKGLDQAEQFRVDALERKAREDAQEKQWEEDMERDLEALMSDGGEDDKEPTTAGGMDGASQEQAAIEVEDHSLDHFFEDDGIMSDVNDASELAAGEKQPEITQASTVSTDASQIVSAQVSTEQPKATGPSEVDWADHPDLSPIREEHGVYYGSTDVTSFLNRELQRDDYEPYYDDFLTYEDAIEDTGVAQAGAETQINAAAAEESEESEEE